MYGRREMTAINSILISGLDKIVVSQMANRPYDGFVKNVNGLNHNLPPQYESVDVFNAKYEMRFIWKPDGERTKVKGRDGFFVVLANAMADTFIVAFNERLSSLMTMAEKDPNGKLASLFARIYKITEFEKNIYKSEGEHFSNIIKENIKLGSEQIAEILKMILLMSESEVILPKHKAWGLLGFSQPLGRA